MKKLLALISFLVLWVLTSLAQSPVTDFTYKLNKVNCHYIMASFVYNTTSNTDADSCRWDFGDGSTYFRTNRNDARHNYQTPGTYTVTLHLWKDSIESTITKTDLVHVVNPPKPSFIIEPADTNRFAPLTVHFENTTVLGECDSVNYAWYIDRVDTLTCKKTDYTFNNRGTHGIQLMVSDTMGCQEQYEDILVVRDTAQSGEFEFITSACQNTSGINTSNNKKQYRIRNDTLFVYGIYLGNCGTDKTATLRYSGDTIKIQSWESGLLALCSCFFNFEIAIPNYTNATALVTFDGQLVPSIIENSHQISYNNAELEVFPTPSFEQINVNIANLDITNYDYQIYDAAGVSMQTGCINSDAQIDVSTLAAGTYLLSISNTDEQTKFVARFMKHE